MWDLNLTRQECRRLVACLKTTRDLCDYRRSLALLRIDRKIPIREIARELFVHNTTIYRWLITYAITRDPASLADGRHENRTRPRFWSDDAQRALEEALQRSPDEWGFRAVNWTVPLL